MQQYKHSTEDICKGVIYKYNIMFPIVLLNAKTKTGLELALKCIEFYGTESVNSTDLWREACVNNYVIKESAPKRREYINNKLK